MSFLPRLDKVQTNLSFYCFSSQSISCSSQRQISRALIFEFISLIYNMQSEATNHQTFQVLPPAIVKQLFAQAFQEFKDENYDINKVARQTISRHSFKQVGNDQQLQWSNNLSQQVIQLSALIGASPKYFFQLLNEEAILSHSHIVTINAKNQIAAKRLFQQFRTSTNIDFDFLSYMQDEKMQKQVYPFLNMVAKKICKTYQECTSLLKKQIQSLTQKIKTSRMMNNFLLYKIFREISDSTRRLIEQKATESAFRSCPIQVIDQFFNYIINKFQIIKLFASPQVGHNLFEVNAAIFLGNIEKNSKIITSSRQAFNNEGKFAIFVKTFSEDAELQKTLEDYLLLIDEKGNLRIANCKILRKKWFVRGQIETQSNITAIAKDYIIRAQIQVDILLKNDPEKKLETMVPCEPLQSYTNYNGVIGRCLYLMKRYIGASDFFKDISKRAILTRSMEQIMHQIPIVGYMILAGTFSANFYKIFSNRFSTDKKKLKQFGGFMLNTTTTVGSSILGAITGQMLIPIPVVGALIGSVIGGFIGQKSGKHLNSWIEKKKFMESIQCLKQWQIDKRYWLCDERFYKMLQIKPAQFLNYLPTYLQDFVFATLIAFVLVCFYQSKRLNQYNLKKAKAIENTTSSHGGVFSMRHLREFQDQVSKMNIGEDFQTQFDITKIIEFLQLNNAVVYQHYDTLEQSILTNLSKIIK